MKYDDVIEATGAFGRYQCFTFAMFGMFSLWIYHALATPFVVMEVDHWCKVKLLNNFSKDEQRYIAIPHNEANGLYDKCLRFDLNFSLYSYLDLLNWNRSEWSDAKTVSCESWNYDTSDYQSSAVITYDLVCGRSWLISFVSTIFLFGTLVGALLWGIISDRFGRKVAAMFTNASTVLGGIICVCAPHYGVFGLGKFLSGFGAIPLYGIGLVYILELTGKNFRSFVGLGYASLFGICYCITAWMAKAFKNDIYLQLALTLPSILYFSYWWIFPESPRWLIVNKRYEDADNAIRKIAKMNNKALDPSFNVHDIEVEETTKQKTILYIFKGPILRRRFTLILQYYSVALNLASLPLDIYITAFCLGLMEVLGPLLGTALVNWKRMGRRITLTVLMVGTGLAGFISLPLIYNGCEGGLLAVVLLGRICLTTAFAVCYFYTPELFPTEVRNGILGASSTIGRVSGLMAAFIGGPLTNVWWALPNVIYGVMGTTAGLLCLLLPETLGQRMCETIDEAEGRTKEHIDVDKEDHYKLTKDHSNEL